MSKSHIIKSVNKGSIADSLGILPGDIVIRIDDQEIEDIFDYQFFTMSDNLILTVLREGEEWEYDIEKGENEDLGSYSKTVLWTHTGDARTTVFSAS